MSSAISECNQSVEIDTGHLVNTLSFTTNGEYLVSGGYEGVQVWQVKSGERVATMPAQHVYCAAISKDDRWIAAGSYHDGELWVWDATTYERVLAHRIGKGAIRDVDFSPDSTRLVSANGDYTATVWNIATRQKVRILDHGGSVRAAKYSPQGDRIATADRHCIRLWNSDDGSLLVRVEVGLRPWRGLHWFKNSLFVIAEDNKIKQVDASTASSISEWSVPATDNWSCVALPQHGKFTAYSTGDNITFWDTSTHIRPGLIPRSSKRCSIALSPDDRLLAVVVQEQKIIIRALSLLKEPDIHIENAALNAWKNAQLTEAEALLTAAIPTSKDTAHHILASRALVRARLQQWDAALVDAEKSIETQSSVVGYIAKCIALVGKGDTSAACRVCDISLQLYSNRIAILLLFKAVFLFMAGEHKDAMLRINDLIPTAYFDSTFNIVQARGNDLIPTAYFDSTFNIVQARGSCSIAYMYLLLGNMHMEGGDYERAIQSFEDARIKLGNHTRPPLLIVSLISGWRFDDLGITIQQRSCEALLLAGRTKEACESVLRMVDQVVNNSEPIRTWATEFMQRCLSTPDNSVNVTSVTASRNNELHPLMQLSREWAKLRLTTGMWKDALIAALSFTLPRSTIYRVICERLETIGRVADAVACFHQMRSELEHETDGKQANWACNFKSRCCKKLEDLGDGSMGAKQCDVAISQYTIALSLNLATPRDLLCKRSKAYAGKEKWEDALSDAREAIKADSSSPLGYERKHAALHGVGSYDDAMNAFEAMLLKMSQSSNPEIRGRSRHYVRPEETRERIRVTIENTIRDSPLVLINTSSGRLYNKSEQASAFETTPAFMRLVSSMITHIDNTRIEQEIEEYYRYATFSHKWEANEPLFENVIEIVVFDLEASPTHGKLQGFCKIVREAGFNWAWSDTCCINKGDHFALQEALVSMFQWYERSAMTIIFLRGVDRLAVRGALTRSIWNMRAWTLQEYHASKVVRIYTEDWTPYLGLEIYNHKESPEVISEMEEATSISARALMTLRPGLDNIREKLRLASTRQTTRVEDAAYSLLGIFSLTLPVVYGEGERALGRLLAQLLTSSGDMSILAWTGRSNSFNSCLPASITVFSQPPTSHIPPAILQGRMEAITAGLGWFDLSLAASLYDRLQELPVPLVTGRRIKLPCLAFKLGRVVVSSQSGPVRAFRARTNELGVVEIRTKENLFQCNSLYLIHPWINFLLDRLPFPEPLDMHPAPVIMAAPSPPVSVSSSEKQRRVLKFIARLEQPFGALLLTQTRQNMGEYRRVATESLIKVQVEEITETMIDRLIQCVRMLDVL